ncbi:unnamed protein product [Cuscuta campestris]|uniref:CCHC-type domain-containing protein n=1 Tax=Cuscuta campestris TaxID=132261 RepID=A0A484K7Q9_9ASTE|nr:unnamed protein product [Cuscuta campestris]
MKKVGDKLISKTEDEFDAEDIKKVENYAKAINMLYCARNPDAQPPRRCGINLRMKEHEKIDNMFDRFSKIVNDLHALKKTYTDRDLVRKILRSLTSEWRSKADVIYESIGTSNVTIDGLRGNLKTYESTILNPSLNDQGKGIALKASKEPAMNESSDEDEVKLVMKKFCKLLRKKEKVEDDHVCYGCGKAGHIKNKCPRRGRNARHFKKQRAYISWGGDSGDESSEQEEEEEANLCLIAQEEEESSNNENQEVRISSTGSYSIEEMQEALQELYDEFVSVSKTNKALKKHFFNLETEFEKLQKENEKLKEENKFYGKRSADKPESSTKPCDSCIALKEQVAELENTVKKFNKPHKDLNLIFDSMQYTKQGIETQTELNSDPFGEKNGAEEFLGDQIADPMIAKRWFERTIRVLGNLRVPQEQRGDLAVALLQDSAYDWWTRVGAGVPEPVQWATFDRLFHEEYIPEHFVEAKREEFLKFTQGELTLPEYRQKFDELEGFGLDLVPTVEKRCKRFVEGLRPDLSTHLIIAPRSDINALYKNALDLNAALIEKAEFTPQLLLSV